MSHDSYWRLMEPVAVADPKGFFDFIAALEKDEHMDAMARLVRWDMQETVTESTVTSQTVKKDYSFEGFYPEFDAKREYNWDNGDYGINHFCPIAYHNEHVERDLKFIGDLSMFMADDLQFLVFEEGWPTMDEGYASLVTAMKGEVVVTPLRLVAVRSK